MADEEDKPKGPQGEPLEKAKLEEVAGALLLPIAKEIVAIEKAGIRAFKKSVTDFRRRRLFEKNKRAIDELFTKEDPSVQDVSQVDKVLRVFEKASDHEVENDDILKLWSSIIERIAEGDPDVDTLLEALEKITPAEATFFLELSPEGSARHLIDFRFFKEIGDGDSERDRVIERSLVRKGLLERRGMVAAIVFWSTSVVLGGVVGFSSVDYLSGFGKGFATEQVLRRMIMLLSGMTGCWVGVLTAWFCGCFTGIGKVHLRLSWIGERLHVGAMQVLNVKSDQSE